MWTREELKARGKAAFRAEYWKNVLVAFILMLVTAGSVSVSGSGNGSGADDQTVQNAQNAFNGLSQTEQALVVFGILGGITIATVISVLLYIFLLNPLKVGCYAFFRENVGYGNADLNLIKDGFSAYGHKFATMFLAGLYTFLWSLLFVIPGIMRAYSYRMVPFIVRDEPDLTASEVLKRSSAMMYGQRWNAFLLDLSFIGWFLLSVCTLGIVGVFWTNPYYYNTNAALYLRLRGEA